MIPLSRRMLMTGAAAIAATWGLPAVAFPRSRPPTSRAKVANLLVTAPSLSRGPFNYLGNCRCAAPELPIGVATFHSEMIMDERYTALRVEVTLLRADVEVRELAFYDKWTTWFFASPDEVPDFAQRPNPDSHRWTWRPTFANTQGLMPLQFPGSPHQSVTLRSAAGSINLIKADSLVGDIDVAQIS